MYPLILQKVFCEPWCVLPEQHWALQEALIAILESSYDAKAVDPTMAQRPFTPIAAGLGLTAPSQPGSRLYTRGVLGVMPVRGVIGSHLSSLEMACGGYGVEQFCMDLERASEDPGIKRLLVDWHSPGGTVTGVPEAAKAFRDFGKNKETFSFTSGMCASAAYYIASQANNTYLTESAGYGSIGVYSAYLDRTEAMAKRGEKLRLFRSGDHKGMGLPGSTLTAEQEKMIQDRVDSLGSQFRSAVKSARGDVSKEDMQGQMFYGRDAIKSKLADATVMSLGSLVKRLS